MTHVTCMLTAKNRDQLRNSMLGNRVWATFGATENARPENAGLENDGQLRKESQCLENAGLENDGQNFSQLWAKLRGLENTGLENDGPR